MARVDKGVTPVEHVEVTITYRNGRTLTYVAREPPEVSLRITWPGHPDISGDAVTMVELPPLPVMKLDVSVTACPRHGITMDRQPAREDDHHG